MTSPTESVKIAKKLMDAIRKARDEDRRTARACVEMAVEEWLKRRKGGA